MTQEDVLLIAKGPITDEQMEDYRVWREEQEKEFADIQKMHNSCVNWQEGQ